MISLLVTGPALYIGFVVFELINIFFASVFFEEFRRSGMT